MTHTLPPGWKEKTLGEVCEIERGGSPRPIKSYLTTAPNGLNWIKIGDTSPNSKYIYSVKEKIRPEGLAKSRWVQEGDFLLSNSMSFGRPYILKTNGCIHDGWLVLKQYQSNLQCDFLYYLLSSPFVQKQFQQSAQGSTVRNLNTQRVAKIIVPIPPFPEQKRIVEKLDKIFAAIDKAKSQTEKKLQNAKDIFKSYFNQLFTPQNTQHWVEQELNRLFYITAGGDKPPVYSKYMTDKCSVPIYSNAVENQGLYGYTNEAAIHLPALTISARGTIGFVCKRESPYFPIVRLLSLVPKNNENNLNFLFYAVQKVVQKSTGSSIPQLTIPMIAKEKIRYPERLEEQQHIVFSLEQFKSLTDKISLICNQKLADLEELKQAVLQQAFSGKL